MGIFNFFHKIKIGFVRFTGTPLPYVYQEKRYGNAGEDIFISTVSSQLPECRIKRNVIVSSPDGIAEIDCLILYQNKLFAIEVKRWKGDLTEKEDCFLQEKTDRWTDETHRKTHTSPFKQLSRAIYHLRKQIPERAWINAIVFFEDADSITVSSDNVYFEDIESLINYIKTDGKTSFGRSAEFMFRKCNAADTLISGNKTLNCIISNDSLSFTTDNGIISRNEIESIDISHRWSFDKIYVNKTDGTKGCAEIENAYLTVTEGHSVNVYPLSKIDRIEIRNTL